MGQYFPSQDELHRVMRLFLTRASEHGVVGPKLQQADMVVRLSTWDPEANVTLHLGDPADGGRRFLTFQIDDDCALADHKTPHATFAQSADFFHRFWCGFESPGIAIVNGMIRATGNYLRALVLFPAIRPLFRTYRESLEESGFAHLILGDHR
ncbi:MAG: hypothetical protein IT350_03820 [Deltaproteobacteria bacterium]|nr:hypothetical protein [Deltaproteobacteria bacterium]